jgi:hypothetical protein
MPIVLLLMALATARAETPVNFEREVRPLLSEKCFQCHGPDSDTRMAGLRLDLKDSAFAARKNGTPVVPGKPEASLLYQRIGAPDPNRRMPPPYAHKTLDPNQVELLKRWIAQGAPWQEHWAFRAPVKPAPPAVRNVAWVRNPIDRFVLHALEADGLTPAAAAGRRTLLRRVALDLTGLPPTPAEIELYLKDTSPQAYEHMVDRYLASPHYGEQRAHFWLDAARYGDTHGIHFDNYREIWPYRDWVVGAFNRDEPFDRFSIEQLAGDLLPKPTLDQMIATGFHRCGVTTNEAGIIEDEYAEIYAKDRADTTAAVWLGLTVGCATCHDHKFDPISQKDFYGLGAFFRNTTQKIMDGNVQDPPPTIFVPAQTDRTRWEQTQQRLAKVRSGMASAGAAAAAAEPFARWSGKLAIGAATHPLDAKDELFAADARALAAAPGDQRLGEADVPGVDAVVFPGSGGVRAAKAPKLDPAQPFSISVSFLLPADAKKNYVVAAQQNSRDKNRGWVLDVNGASVGLRLVGDGGRAIEIRAPQAQDLRHGEWNRVVATYDGSRRQYGLALYVNGRAAPPRGLLSQTAELQGDLGDAPPLVIGKSLAGGAVADLRIFDRALTESEARAAGEWTAVEGALTRDAAHRSDADRAALLDYYLFHDDDGYRALVREKTELDEEAHAIERRGANTLVMQERADAKPFAYVLYRGAYDQKRDRVDARTPAILPPMTAAMPHNRLGFAEWLFTPGQPLTARVAVNRMWQEIFGTGIVKTVDDFGSQGEPPSNQQLLDWLAVDFRESGWDMKRFYRQILLSATYRQDALTTPEKLTKDPENRLLSRGPRFRLDGETIRDYALAASGLLAPEIGGPPVRPYQPEGVWDAVAMEGSNTRFYKQDAGDGLYRRSLYTLWKRAAPPASMEIFNAPSRENCTVRRERTNTPLQALVTMDDPQFVEAARVLAGRSMENSPNFDEQLDYIATRVLIRPLTVKERQIARRSFDAFREHYREDPEGAAALLNTGARKPDPALAQADFAAMTMLTNQLLNLDEVLNQ